MKKNIFWTIIKKIFSSFSYRRKIILGIFFIFSLFSAFAEMASISIVIPFMDLMIDYDKVNIYLSKFGAYIDLKDYSQSQVLVSITLIFISFIALSTFLKIMLGYLGTKISTSVTHEMNTLLFNKIINSEYIGENKIDENNINSSLLQVNSLTIFVEQFLSIVSNIVTLFFVLFFVISLTNEYVIYAGLIFFISYFFILLITKKILNRNSKILAENYDGRVAHLNNTVALFKNIKVDSLEKYFYKIFIKKDFFIAKSNLINAILVSLPGILMITIAIIIFSILIMITTLNNYQLINHLPIYAALIFGIQKILPMMQNIYGGITKARANKFQAIAALNVILKNNKKEKKKKKKIILNFNKSIKLKNINFLYKNNKNLTLKNLNFEMEKGDRILISGPSGSGKTTFLNILLGLIKPSSGHALIDGKKVNTSSHYLLRKFYSYVPQNIFVFNGSYKDNIALNFSKDENIDQKKIIFAAKNAEIHNFIMSTNNNYRSIISHNGRDISGGQLQRIGIARGLFRNTDILIFDESTNSLDLKTENRIYKNFNSKEFRNKILIFISHKKINDKFFNKKYNFVNKKLKRMK